MNSKTIEIFSDNEEKEQGHNQTQKFLQKQIEKQANLFRSLVGKVLAYTSLDMEGTVKEKEQRIAERIKRMYFDKFQFNIACDHHYIKREPNYNTTDCHLLLNELLIFGTDFWPLKAIKTESKGFITQVEILRVDDSHAKLIFISNQEAKKWLSIYNANPGIKSKLEQQNQEMDQDQIKSNDSLKGWFELHPYYFQGFQRKREARFCTNNEKNMQSLIEQTKMSTMEKFKMVIEQQFNIPQDQSQYLDLRRQNRMNRSCYKKKGRDRRRDDYERRQRPNNQEWSRFDGNNYSKVVENMQRIYQKKPRHEKNKQRNKKDRSRQKYDSRKGNRGHSYYEDYQDKYSRKNQKLHFSNMQQVLGEFNRSIEEGQQKPNYIQLNNQSNAVDDLAIQLGNVGISEQLNMSIQLGPNTNQKLNSQDISVFQMNEPNQGIPINIPESQRKSFGKKQNNNSDSRNYKLKPTEFDYQSYIESQEREQAEKKAATRRKKH